MNNNLTKEKKKRKSSNAVNAAIKKDKIFIFLIKNYSINNKKKTNHSYDHWIYSKKFVSNDKRGMEKFCKLDMIRS